MRKINVLVLFIMVFAFCGCKKESSGTQAPVILRVVDPVQLSVIEEAAVGQQVQLVGENMKNISKITVNGIEIPVASATILPGSIYINIPRIPRSESFTITIENEFGSSEYPISIVYPPMGITGLLNEFAPEGTELVIFGESMDLYAVAGQSKVKFNDIDATVTAVTETEMKVTVPAGVPNKAVISFMAGGNKVICPVRYRDDTYTIENLEDPSKTRYPAFVVPNADFPAPLNPAPIEGNNYSRIKVAAGTSGAINMVGNYNLVIPESYFTTDADNYNLKFELCTITPIAYRIAVSINQGSNFYYLGPMSATTNESLMVSTNGKWQTITAPMSIWKGKGGTKNLRVYIGGLPAGLSYDFCLDNFRLQPIAWD